MCYCVVFLVKALLGVLASFTMIASANMVHERMRERVAFAGVSCLFLFLFSWVRAGAVRRELSAARQRGSMSVWGTLDLLVIFGGIVAQMVFAWQTSTNTATGGATEDAFTIFWLWVLFLLCSLLVTPTGGAAAIEVAAPPKKTRSLGKTVVVTEHLGDAVDPIALGNRLGDHAPVRLDKSRDKGVGRAEVWDMDARLEALCRASVDGVHVIDCARFLVMTYARIQWLFVTGQLDLREHAEYGAQYGASPVHLLRRAVADADLERHTLALCFVLPDIFSERNLHYDDALLFAIQLMCARAIVLACGTGGELPCVTARALYALDSAKVNKRTLLGARKNAPILGVPARLSQLKAPLQVGDQARFDKVCEMCDFTTECASVYDALEAFSMAYNQAYLGRDDS